MSDATFVLMNCDLVAVPLQLDRGGSVTVYCGARRARQLLEAPAALHSQSNPNRSHGAATQNLGSARSEVPLGGRL